MVRRIGEMLRLHAERIASVINSAAFTFDALKMVGGIELQTWLGREHFQYSSALRVRDLRGQTQFARRFVEALEGPRARK